MLSSCFQYYYRQIKEKVRHLVESSTAVAAELIPCHDYWIRSYQYQHTRFITYQRKSNELRLIHTQGLGPQFTAGMTSATFCLIRLPSDHKDLSMKF